VLAINKMDLVDWDEATYERIHDEFRKFATKLNIPDLEVIPISALKGDNVVERSENLAWFGGPTLLQYLEEAPVAAGLAGGPLRLPVQWVVRDQETEHRGYAGQLASGTVRVGDEVVVLPAGTASRVSAIDAPSGPVEAAGAPLSIAVQLEDQLDVARGALIHRVGEESRTGREIDATICWVGEAHSQPRGRYLLKHTTNTVRAVLDTIHHTLEVEQLTERGDADSLSRNEIGRVTLRISAPLFFDRYADNRTTGSFILIDEASNETVGAGMIDDGR
jgi:sulfate adenylyltransferase subunit 1 (EFTu-like GTPase family)